MQQKIDELGAVRPRFMRNLTGNRANFYFKLSRIPALIIHWPEIGLAVTRQSRPISHATHWAKSSRAQAGQLLVNQSAPLLV